mmetsp:Transcript_94306/g.224596  ORF Transcript_94306/g.224596 Transcript_94306/m.224596 type:complete len:269 (+) Transcript_94306:568-1374(+)
MLAPHHKALAIVLALGLREVRRHVLRLVQRLPHAPPVVLQQPPVDHQLDLPVAHTASARLGHVGKHRQLSRLVPNEECGGDRVVIACHLLRLVQLPGGSEVAASLQHLAAVGVAEAAALGLEVRADAGDNLLTPAVVHRNLTHGVGHLRVPGLLGQAHALHEPRAHHLHHLVGQRPPVDLQEGQAIEDGQRLVPGGPEDVGAAGLVAGLVTHRGVVPKEGLLRTGGDVALLVRDLGQQATAEFQGQVIVLQHLAIGGVLAHAAGDRHF